MLACSQASREDWSASLAMTEISDFSGIVLVVTVGFALAVLSTKLTERVRCRHRRSSCSLPQSSRISGRDLYEAVDIETVERIAVVALS